MKREYEIRFYQDKQYAVYGEDMSTPLFIGTLEEVNAWISLREKGYDI